jgi:DNA/RNA endonuclease YhcR with UshA esterase domain
MFKGKKVQVTGAIKTYQKQFEIEVNSPDQIKIIEDEKEGDNKAAKKS